MSEQRIFELIYIKTSLAAVWNALTNPEMTQQYWGGTRIEPWIPPVGFASQPDLQAERDKIAAMQTGYQNTLKAKINETKAWLAAAEKAAAAFLCPEGTS